MRHDEGEKEDAGFDDCSILEDLVEDGEVVQVSVVNDADEESLPLNQGYRADSEYTHWMSTGYQEESTWHDGKPRNLCFINDEEDED